MVAASNGERVPRERGASSCCCGVGSPGDFGGGDRRVRKRRPDRPSRCGIDVAVRSALDDTFNPGSTASTRCASTVDETSGGRTFYRD